MPRQPVALGYQEGRSPPLAASRLVNLYMETAPLNSRAPKFPAGAFQTVTGPAYGTPGLAAFATVPITPDNTSYVRAMRYALTYLYVLYKSSLFRVSSTGTVELCTGSFIPSTGTAMMTDNGIQLTVLSGGLCFVVTGTSIAQNTSTSYPAVGVGSIDTMDGYTIFTTASGAGVSYGTARVITGITNANPAVVTSANHGLLNQDQVLIASVSGMPQVNARTLQIINVTANTFELDGIDSTLYGVYASGGTASPVVAQAAGQWFISALYDSTVIHPLDCATAESSPDALLRVLVHNREVWLFGSDTTEPWQNTGASPFPFERVSGSILEKGTIAGRSPAKVDNSVFWLGSDKIVYRAQGYQPVRISNFAVEEAIRDCSDVSDAFGMTYVMGGHTFYVLSFPTMNRTFAYDVATQVWHERASGTSLTPVIWAVSCIESCWGKVLAGTNGINTTTKVCQLDLDTYSEVGNPIRRVAVTPPFYANGNLESMPLIELECELGVGLSTGQGEDPTVMVRFSDDGGATFSNQREASLRRMGDRINRAMVRRLGTFRQREVEFSISDPVKVCFYGIRFERKALAA